MEDLLGGLGRRSVGRVHGIPPAGGPQPHDEGEAVLVWEGHRLAEDRREVGHELLLGGVGCDLHDRQEVGERQVPLRPQGGRERGVALDEGLARERSIALAGLACLVEAQAVEPEMLDRKSVV